MFDAIIYFVVTTLGFLYLFGVLKG